MRIRPCIDIHKGKVKQIVGDSLDVSSQKSPPDTHFTSKYSPAYYAKLYQRDGLSGGHVIMLGSGNSEAAAEALSAFPYGLQLGGGITPQNAPQWLERGARKVIVTSYVFQDKKLDWERLREMKNSAGRGRLVLDLSCRLKGDKYIVTADRWATDTELEINRTVFQQLEDYCSEFLVHAVDKEGKKAGIDCDVVALLSEISDVPVTYAGGVTCMDDLYNIESAGDGNVDVTVGSSLDIFGGSLLRYQDLVEFDKKRRKKG